jgi:hypothetical protein
MIGTVRVQGISPTRQVLWVVLDGWPVVVVGR